MEPVFCQNLKLLCQFDIIMSSGQKTVLKQKGKNTKIIENIGELATTSRICKSHSVQAFKLHFHTLLHCVKISLCSILTPFTVLRMDELLSAIPSAVSYRNSPSAHCSTDLRFRKFVFAKFGGYRLHRVPSLPKYSLSSLPFSFHSSGFELRNFYTFVNLQTFRFFRLSWQVGNENI